MAKVKACIVIVIMCAVELSAMTPGRPERLLNAAKTTKVASVIAGAKSVAVDCTKGQSIQEAIDKNAGPLVIDVHGICVEDVRIERKVVTLRGMNSLSDGIQGVSSEEGAVTFSYVNGAGIENLSISNGPGLGLSFLYAEGFVTNCRVVGNSRSGVLVAAGSNVIAEALISNGNRNGAVAQNGGLFQCVGCTISGNVFWAAQGQLGGIVSIGDSVITGGNGVFASLEGYAEVYCESSPCSVNVSGTAVWGSQRGTAALLGVGDFTGQIWADASGDTQVFGSNQTSSTGVNIIDSFGTLWIDSGRLSTRLQVDYFGRVLVRGSTSMAAHVDCHSAGDVWLDPDTVLSPGVVITGCEHASPQ